MPGWTKEKRKVVEEGFYAYLNRAKLFSKDFSGEIILGQHLYDGQVRFITETFDALEQDIHKIYVLKSRQLGLSTIARALTSFLLGFHNGLKGVCVFDTSENRAESRAELEALIDHLPRSLKFPVIETRNRSGITLANNSKILFLSAGVKKTKTSGTLGRSLGVSLAHLSELCSYDNDEGLEAFENSLSDANPDRLYIYESTARGYNTWNTTWEEARKDPAHCKCIFLGWWSKPSQSIPRDSADFQLYGLFPPSDKEQVKIRTVLEKYGHQITPEQLAWIRRKMNPTAVAGDAGDADPEFEGSNARIQEQPWCVTVDTRVGTDRGLVTIDEAIQSKECVRGKIIAGGVTGRARIWKVKTKLGYEFTGTANHPLITIDNGQINLSESFGAKIRLQPPMLAKQDYWFAFQELPFEWRVDVTADLARFIGLFMGDGSASAAHRHSITEVSICCDKQDGDVVSECVRLFETVFGVVASLNARDGWVTVRTGQHSVFKALQRLSLLREDSVKTQRRVHVPWFMWRCPREILKEFLKGLFEADGYNGPNRVALFSKYPEFIKDVQLLLLAFGITSRSVSMRKRAGDGHFYTGNQLELRTAEAAKFNAEIGFISVRKAKKRELIPYKIVKQRPVIVFEDEVVSVEDTGRVEDVWNLTVENEHLFDANGILTHNTEDEAFQQTGATFFSPEVLTDQTNKFVSNKFKNYMFHAGEEFINMRAYKARTIRESELKVWEEPEVGGCYVIAVDPAYGENEKNDRSSIQILRCYADGLDQVAEYSSPLITTRHLAWVLAALLGWYGEGTNEVRYIMELMGPGNQVFQSLKDLQVYLRIGHQMREVHERGLTDIFKNVQTYIYTRPDSMGAGHNYHWVSSSTRKVMIFEALRDYVSNGTFRIRSAELIKEMNSIARDGDSIEAPGSKKDDKVVAAAMGVQYWLERVKTSLMARKMTREAEAAKKMMSIKDQVQLFNQNHLDMFFSQKRTSRYRQQALMRRASWRYQPRVRAR